MGHRTGCNDRLLTYPAKSGRRIAERGTGQAVRVPWADGAGWGGSQGVGAVVRGSDRVLRGEAVVGFGKGRGTWSGIVPDGLWEIAKPLIPPSRVRPQGGGTQDTPDETLFAAIVYVLVSGCAWRQLPPCFGVSKSTAHRRFLIWSRAGVWGRLHEAVLHRLDDTGLIDVTRVVLDTAHVRAKRGRTHRSEPHGPGQAGLQDAHPVGRERAAPSRRHLGRHHPRQRRAEAHGGGAPNETRPPPRPVPQAPAPSRRQGV